MSVITQSDGRTKENIMSRFPSVFTGELGTFQGDVHLDVDPLITQEQTPLRKVPLAVKEGLEGELKRLEELGVIVRVSEPTEWVSSIVVTEKKEGQKLRLCIDPKPLNNALKSIYPLPTMEDVLPQLGKAKVFSVCDLKNGFWHCTLDTESSLLTTFITPYGRYRWTQLPFGVSPAPEVFQWKLTEQLEGLKGVTMIAEDVLVFGQGNNYDEAVKDYDAHLLTFLRRAEERGLKINAQKFKYRLEEVSYAGHVLTHQGLKVDSRKIEALQKMEEPTDVASLRRFLGTANYLGKFVKNLADICEPLRQLTK